MAQRLSRLESKARTHVQLLDAARRVFARSGFGGASIDLIAAEAGYSKGAFYSNFDSKDAIFLELLSRHMAREVHQLNEIVGAAGSAQQIFDNLNAWLAHMNADADWALLAMELQLQARRSTSFAKQYNALYARHRDELAALLVRLFALSGKVPPAPSAALASALMALAHGLVLQRSNYEGKDPAGELLQTVLRSLIVAAEPTRDNERRAPKTTAADPAAPTKSGKRMAKTRKKT